MLVGVDGHSDHPVEVIAALPKVGPDLTIDVAAVAALEPDLVLATLTVPGHEAVVEGLEAAGLPFIAPEPVSLEDVYGDIANIGARLGVPERSDQLILEMRSEIGSPPPDAPGPGILVQWWPKPVISPGRLSWVNDLIAAAGGVNPLGREAVISRPLNDAEVQEMRPDAIVISWCGVDPEKYRPDVVLENPAWQELPAIQNGHVFCVPEAYLGRPGPRLLDGVRALRGVVAWMGA